MDLKSGSIIDINTTLIYFVSDKKKNKNYCFTLMFFVIFKPKIILDRPMSPHLSVYAWTIPMAMSSANRIFAFALVFGFLLFPVIDILGSGDVVADIAGFR